MFHKIASDRKFEVDDLVLAWNARGQDKGKHDKFKALWLGPYVVTEKHGDDSYFLANMKDFGTTLLRLILMNMNGASIQILLKIFLRVLFIHPFLKKDKAQSLDYLNLVHKIYMKPNKMSSDITRNYHRRPQQYH